MKQTTFKFRKMYKAANAVFTSFMDGKISAETAIESIECYICGFNDMLSTDHKETRAVSKYLGEMQAMLIIIRRLRNAEE